ncbi:MAG: hypothetical protein MZW92_07120 [Comamonadaceae bacterium]|nr:hypothetical protein [Comamonadaceae bacterium]
MTGAAFTGSYAGTKTVTTTVQGGWSYTIPNNTFSDPEGATPTYTAWLIDGDGNATEITSVDGDTAIDFDASTRTLSGDGSALAHHTIEIRAQDPLGLTASARMALYLDDGASGVALAGG